jgi:arsenate reductase-like glutaredoxin family protein
VGRGYDPAMSAATPAAPSVQIFGHDRDPGTRAAVRFFKERRIAIHQVDVTRKPIAPGELRRFTERLGARALVDETSRPWRDGGLGYLRMDDRELVERLLRDASLLRLPLVRFGNDVAAGRDEATWKRWLSSSSRAAT